MKNNSIVTASDSNYIWGVLLLLASMRKNGMDEPFVVLGQNYTAEDKEVLKQFANVKIFEAKPTQRSLACSKGEAMLHAQTDYITWVDCDGFFDGNVSNILTPPAENIIHIRKRSPEENRLAFATHKYGESGETIPEYITTQWQKDVANAGEQRLFQCCSDCFFSVHKQYRDFIALWDDQMKKVLPVGNQGVVDNRQKYYHQLDESVLNSLLAFAPNAPKVIEKYQMDCHDAKYIHFVCQPKPWVDWIRYSFLHYEKYLEVVDFLIENGYKLPSSLPLSLNRKYKTYSQMRLDYVHYKRKFKRLMQKIGVNI